MGRMVEISGLGMPGLELYAGLTNAQLRSVKQGGQNLPPQIARQVRAIFIRYFVKYT